MNKTQTLLRNVLLRQTEVPCADAIGLVSGVVRKGKADAASATLAARDYRPLPAMPKGSKTGDYAVPAEYQPVVGGAVVSVRWKKGYTQFYPMFAVDGAPVRKKDANGEHTEAYRVIRQAFAAGIIPVAAS